MIQGAPATVTQPTETLTAQLETVTPGQVLYQGAVKDPKAATEALLAAHPDAKLTGGTLTLPAVDAGAVQQSASLDALGTTLGGETGVSSVTVGTVTEDGVDIQGNINPQTKLATVKTPPLAASVVTRLASERVDLLLDAWEEDVKKSKLSDTHKNGNAYTIFDTYSVKKNAADARAEAEAILIKESKLKAAPKTETAMRKALTEKDGVIKTKFQSAAGDKVAEAVRVYGENKAKTDAVKAEIQNKVRFEPNLQLGRIDMPGTGETTHSLYKPDPASYTKKKLKGGGFEISFRYKPPYQAMHFTVVVDKNNLVRESKGFNLTLKGADGTVGRGGMGTSPAHEPNQAMHNAHVIGDCVRGSGYREAHNLVTTSDHYNLHEMRSAEIEVERFVAGIDPKGAFDLTVSVDWEKIDSAASIQEILANNPQWDGETAADVRAELANYLTGFGSQLQRVKSLLYEVTVKKSGDSTMVARGADVYLGV